MTDEEWSQELTTAFYALMDKVDFCGCGDPVLRLKYVSERLNYIHLATIWEGKTRDEWSRFNKAYSAYGSLLFSCQASEELFYEWCMLKQLIEHGSCMPGWLTDTGKEIMEDLNAFFKLLEEEEKQLEQAKTDK